VGNRLKGDDGVGSLIAGELEQALGKEKVCDAGIAPENHLSWVEKHKPDVLIIIDSVNFQDQPGKIRLFSLKELSQQNLFTHNLPLGILGDFLSLLGVDLVYILGIQPKQVQFGEGLSPAVERAKELVKELFLRLSKRWVNCG